MPIGDLLASITGDSSTVAAYTPVSAPQKRKAEGDLRGQNDKTMRREPSTLDVSRPVMPMKKPANVDTSGTKAQSNTATTTSVKSPLSAVSRPPITTANSLASKPPKKGSFAEIMARGKAASTTMSQVGKIQHKRIEKTSHKRDKEEDKGNSKPGNQKLVNGKPRLGASAQVNGRDGKGAARDAAGKVAGRAPEPDKKVKKAALATTGYTGTARPVPGKAAPAPSSRYGGSGSRDRDRDRDLGSSRRYTYADEDEEDEDMEEEEDYYSDASSDMEAATFEVDEEEERAARIARKEDAAALAEENRLKREKEEKRKRLAAMASKRR